MLSSTKNGRSSAHRFYDLNANNKIPQYYLSINNHQMLQRFSSSLSFSSVSSSLFSRPKTKLKTSAIRNSRRQITDSLSSLSTTSLSSSMTIILHTFHEKHKQQKNKRTFHHRKKIFNKNHSRYRDNYSSSSSSSNSLPRLTPKTKLKSSCRKSNELNTHQRNKKISNKTSSMSNFVVDNSFADSTYLSEKSHRIFKAENTTALHSKTSLSSSNSECNNDLLIEKNTNDSNNHQKRLSTMGTQTDNFISIREQYQYGNLRRVNSDLLDYIFIPVTNTLINNNCVYSLQTNTNCGDS